MKRARKLVDGIVRQEHRVGNGNAHSFAESFRELYQEKRVDPEVVEGSRRVHGLRRQVRHGLEELDHYRAHGNGIVRFLLEFDVHPVRGAPDLRRTRIQRRRLDPGTPPVERICG
jgi:hypothetical protein